MCRGGLSPPDFGGRVLQWIPPCGAGSFLSVQKGTKETPGDDSPCQGEMSRSDRGGRDRSRRDHGSTCVPPESRSPLSPGPPDTGTTQRGFSEIRPARQCFRTDQRLAPLPLMLCVILVGPLFPLCAWCFQLGEAVVCGFPPDLCRGAHRAPAAFPLAAPILPRQAHPTCPIPWATAS